MIKNIIFDFGDIFLNLDKEAVFVALRTLGCVQMPQELYALAQDYETGQISSQVFLEALQHHVPGADAQSLKEAWNSILLDFPEHRLRFIEALKKEGRYRLFLLSNTNALHIAYVKEAMGLRDYNRFKSCFEGFYLSHEIKLRKPDPAIYGFVLHQNGLKAEETFFVDDTRENIDAAIELGIRCWHLNVGQEDIVQLNTKL